MVKVIIEAGFGFLIDQVAALGTLALAVYSAIVG